MVLGGWAVFLAALAFGLASPGTVFAAKAGITPAAGATDGAGDHFLARVVIAAPSTGATYRVGEPVALHGDVSAKDSVSEGAVLRWTVLRHTGAVTERAAEATGKDASFVPAPGSAGDATYEVRLTATFGDHEIAAEPVLLVAAAPVLGAPAGSPDPPVGAGPVPGPPAAGPAVGPATTSDSGLTTQTPPQQGIATALVVRHSPALGIAGAVRFELPVVRLTAAGAGERAVRGTLRDVAAGARIQIALRRAGDAGGCDWWSPRRHRYLAGACTSPRYITATLKRRAGTLRWRADLGSRLPGGAHSTLVRLLDRHGRMLRFVRGA